MIETTQESSGSQPGVVARLLKGTEATILTATLALVTILLLIDAVGQAARRIPRAGQGRVRQAAHALARFRRRPRGGNPGQAPDAVDLGVLRGRARAPALPVVRLLGVGGGHRRSGQGRVRHRPHAPGSWPSRKMLPIGMPEWVSEAVMPIALALMALVFAYKASDRWWGRAVAFLAIPAAFATGLLPSDAVGLPLAARARRARGCAARRPGVHRDGRHCGRPVLRRRDAGVGGHTQGLRPDRVADAARPSRC